MIIDDTFEMDFINGQFPKVDEIENAIKSRGIDPVRYFIVDVLNNKIKIEVSGIKID